MAVQTIPYIKGRFTTGAVPSEQDFTDLVDTVVAVAQTKTATYIFKDAPTGNQVPSGNTFLFAPGVNVLDVMTRNNIPLQWAQAGVTYNINTGIIDFTAIGGMQDGDILSISYY